MELKNNTKTHTEDTQDLPPEGDKYKLVSIWMKCSTKRENLKIKGGNEYLLKIKRKEIGLTADFLPATTEARRK